MKQPITMLLIVFLLASCAGSKKTARANDDRDGLSKENAIILKANTEQEGVAAEYKWVRQHYPGYQLKSQSAELSGKIKYDILKIDTAKKEDLTLYFDITGFFGKGITGLPD